MTGEVKSLNEITDFESIACDFSELLVRADNADIKQQFPGTVQSYTGDLTSVVAKLEAAQADCTVGVREQFVIFSGARAVGMSVIRLIDDTPPAINPLWPNISGFVCNPYRAQGLGRKSMQRRMQSVQENFGNRAWTYVIKGNTPSEKLVLEAGFKRSDQIVLGREDHSLYIYSGK